MAWTILNSLGQIKTAIGGDHGALTGLTDDDHTQYALLAGRATGQTLIGGTASGDDLTLNSTSNATKGDVLVQTGGGNVIVGGGTTASRLRLLEASGSGTNYTEFVAQAQAGNITYTLPVDDGTSGQVLSTDGSGSLSWANDAGGGFTLGTEQASTSGTAIDFTSIPAGTTVIIIRGIGVSTNGTASLVVQIGDAGGVETGTYASTSLGGASGNTLSGNSVTAGFGINGVSVAGSAYTFTVILTLEDSTNNVWVSSSTSALEGAANARFGAGSHDGLDSELTTVRITTASDDDFDAGVINILYS